MSEPDKIVWYKTTTRIKINLFPFVMSDEVELSNFERSDNPQYVESLYRGSTDMDLGVRRLKIPNLPDKTENEQKNK